jgi:hypothetical protein
MDKLDWLQHQGKEILALEFVPGQSDGSQTLTRLVELLSERPATSVLFLVDLRQARYRAAMALEWQRQQGLLDSKCEKIAAFGVHGLIGAATRIFLSVAESMGTRVSSKVRFFEDAEQARSWLIE